MIDLRAAIADMIRKMGDYPGAQLECADQIIATVDAARAQEQEDRYTIRTMTQNDRGQWVPAIPMPFVTTWNKYRCTCRKKPFWTLEEYKQHWVYEHVYQGRPERP